MPLRPSPLLRGFEQGSDGEDVWNRMLPGEERGPLALDPQGVALGQHFAAIKAGIEAQQARPIWNPNNRVGEESLQSMGMPQPTTYAGPVGQFIDPATGQLTTQGVARMNDNPALGFDTGGVAGVTKIPPRLTAAMRYGDQVFTGSDHLRIQREQPDIPTDRSELGFVNAVGKWMPRRAAFEYALEHDLIDPRRAAEADRFYKAMDEGGKLHNLFLPSEWLKQ